MMQQKPFIELSNVSRSFGRVKAVDNVSFSVGRGEFFSLLGPSGCGKTTLLRLLAGLEVPTSGKIVIDGSDMSRVAANRRPTNMVFQSYAIFPHLSVTENIGYGLANRKLERAEIAKRVQDALRLIKLEGYGERRPHQLSGGQRQRVALARALVCEPKVLLLDEPLGALDKKLREEMQIELRQLQRTVGITFVFVTHDQEEALALSDRIAVMSKGVVKQIDSAAQLYESPKSREVAEFIGNMNFLEGKVVGQDGEFTVVAAAGIGQFTSGSAHLPVGAAATIAIRPEKITLHTARPAAEPNVLQGTMITSTYMGDRNQHFVSVNGISKPIIVSSQNAVPTQNSPNGGDSVWLSWPVAAGILLSD
jgi:spermidine/putrescine ABC transporter ATP-binding subunit